MTARQEHTEAAIADPTRKYKTPMDVVNDGSLQTEQKRQILESWRKDAELLSTAANENMAGGEAPQLQAVVLAIQDLEKLSGEVH